MVHALLVFLTLATLSIARAELKMHPDVSQGASLNQWISNTHGTSGSTNCATLTDVSGVSLCIYSDNTMLKALARADLWAEGSGAAYPQHQLYGQNSPAVAEVARHIAGMDLKGRDLLAFYKASQDACPTQPNMCLSKEEKELFSGLIMPNLKRNQNYILITGMTTLGSKKTAAIIDHEIYHARYFASEKYRQIVMQDWNALGDADKATMMKFLSDGYDTNDMDLVRNEWMAYSLDTARELSGAPIGGWATKLRGDLYNAGLLPNNVDPYRNSPAASQ